jgi:hypothetical protein
MQAIRVLLPLIFLIALQLHIWSIWALELTPFAVPARFIVLLSLLPFFFCYLLARNCECLIIDLCFSLKKNYFRMFAVLVDFVISWRFLDALGSIWAQQWRRLASLFSLNSFRTPRVQLLWPISTLDLIPFFVPTWYVFYSCFCFSLPGYHKKLCSTFK